MSVDELVHPPVWGCPFCREGREVKAVPPQALGSFYAVPLWVLSPRTTQEESPKGPVQVLCGTSRPRSSRTECNTPSPIPFWEREIVSLARAQVLALKDTCSCKEKGGERKNSKGMANMLQLKVQSSLVLVADGVWEPPPPHTQLAKAKESST